MRHKKRDVLERLSADCQRQIIAAAHQIARFHLAELGDGVGDLLESHRPLWNYLDLDARRNKVAVGLIPVDQRLVATDDALFFITGDRLRDILRILAEHDGKLLVCELRVVVDQP